MKSLPILGLFGQGWVVDGTSWLMPKASRSLNGGSTVEYINDIVSVDNAWVVMSDALLHSKDKRPAREGPAQDTLRPFIKAFGTKPVADVVGTDVEKTCK